MLQAFFYIFRKECHTEAKPQSFFKQLITDFVTSIFLSFFGRLSKKTVTSDDFVRKCKKIFCVREKKLDASLEYE